MSDQTDDEMNAVSKTNDHKEHAIKTGKLTTEPGYAAWVTGRPGLKTTGESRWEAVYHLAISLAGLEDKQ